MKKLLFAALLTASLATSAFAKETNNLNYRVEKNFSTDFNKATDVTWSVKQNFAKATFNINGEKMEAFYNLNGEMIGTSKNITFEQLPTDAKKSLAKLYNGYVVKQAIRFENNDETAYYVSVENETKSLVLKISNDRTISVFKKDSK